MVLVFAVSLATCNIDLFDHVTTTDISSPSDPAISDMHIEDELVPLGSPGASGNAFVNLINERWKHVLYGSDGQVVLLDIASDTEISDFLDETWDPETGSYVDGWIQLRADFIQEAEQAYELSGTELSTLPRSAHRVTLINADMNSPMGQEFEWLFYCVTSSDGKSYVFPSEWDIGDDPALVFDAERSVLYVSTFLGVWKISPDGTSIKLTADEYNGMHYSQHDTAAYDDHIGSSLFWTANALISPDSRFIIYRSNRDCYDEGSENMSLWRIDLETGEEQRILEGNAVNRIDGFVTDTMMLIDQQFLLDVSTGASVQVSLPNLSNRFIESTGFGYIICSSYREEEAGLSSLYIFRVEPETGALTEVLTISGVFRDSGFSASGKYAYANYGSEPDQGAVTVLFFDLENSTIMFLEDVLGETYNELGGTVTRAKWLTGNSMLLQVLSIIDDVGVYRTWIAKW